MSIKISDLEKYGEARDKFLMFLYELEELGLLESELEHIKDRTERVWYPKHEDVVDMRNRYEWDNEGEYKG